MTLASQPSRHARAAIKGRARVLFINQSHHEEVLLTFRSRFVIKARPGQLKQLTLPNYTYLLMARLDQQPLTL
jgi:hypothetical protein